jgi:hypothetical protein
LSWIDWSAWFRVLTAWAWPDIAHCTPVHNASSELLSGGYIVWHGLHIGLWIGTLGNWLRLHYLTIYIDWQRSVVSSLVVQVSSVVWQRLAAGFLSNSQFCSCNTKQNHFLIYISTFEDTSYYEGNLISKLQIQVATYVFELSGGNCHR